MNGFNAISQQFIAKHNSVCQIYCTGLVSSRGFNLCSSTPKYHAADKHDTPPSHFKLTLGHHPCSSPITCVNLLVFDLYRPVIFV